MPFWGGFFKISTQSKDVPQTTVPSRWASIHTSRSKLRGVAHSCDTSLCVAHGVGSTPTLLGSDFPVVGIICRSLQSHHAARHDRHFFVDSKQVVHNCVPAQEPTVKCVDVSTN